VVDVGEAVTTQRLADLLFRRGVLVMGFCHPVVPEGTARLRLQLSVRHTQEDLDRAARALAVAAREVGLL
jgi:glycine C-acetyltransferase